MNNAKIPQVADLGDFMYSIKYYDTEDLYKMLHTMKSVAEDMNLFCMNNHMCHDTNEFCASCSDKVFCEETGELIEWSVNHLAEFK